MPARNFRRGSRSFQAERVMNRVKTARIIGAEPSPPRMVSRGRTSQTGSGPPTDGSGEPPQKQQCRGFNRPANERTANTGGGTDMRDKSCEDGIEGRRRTKDFHKCLTLDQLGNIMYGLIGNAIGLASFNRLEHALKCTVWVAGELHMYHWCKEKGEAYLLGWSVSQNLMLHNKNTTPNLQAFCKAFQSQAERVDRRRSGRGALSGCDTNGKPINVSGCSLCSDQPQYSNKSGVVYDKCFCECWCREGGPTCSGGIFSSLCGSGPLCPS